VPDLAKLKRLTTAGRECVEEDKTMDPNTAIELVRIFELIDRTIKDDRVRR